MLNFEKLLVSRNGFFILATTLTRLLIPITVYSVVNNRSLQSQAAQCFDFTGDGIVDVDDVELVEAHLGAVQGYPGPPPYVSTYDLNNDGSINWRDVLAMNTHLGETCPPTASFSGSPTSITQGGSTTLSWTTTRTSSVSINQGVGSVAKSGSKTVSPSSTKTYTLTATGPGGTVTKSVTINVSSPPSPPPSEPSPSQPPPSPSESPPPSSPTSPPSSGGIGLSPSSNISPTAPPAGDNSITFISVKISSLVELSGNKTITLSVPKTKFTQDVTINNKTSELRVKVKRGVLTQGKSYVLSIKGDKLLTRKIKFTAKNYKPSLKAGSLFLGDVDGNNKVNQTDLDKLLGSFFVPSIGDINLDGVVNSLDYSIVIKNLGRKGN